MGTNSRIRIFLLPLIITSNVYASPVDTGSGDSIAEQQKKQIEEILKNMNQSSKEVTDTVMSDPQNAIDAGCLDDINGIDLSVFTIDITNAWGVIYNKIKDRLLNMACNSSAEWVNSQTSELDGELNTPIGSASIGKGSAIKDWKNTVSADVEMDNEELSEKVTTEALGDVPKPSFSSKGANRLTSDLDTPGTDTEKWEDTLEDALNLKSLWGEEGKENK